jgi:hypothetical protein
MFASENIIAARFRNFGLNLTNSIPVIKTFLSRRAIAVGGGLRRKEPS